MSWVIGGLLAILAIALVIAGATGHAEQLFQGITGKSTTPKSSSKKSGAPTATTASDAIDAALTGLAQTGAATSPGTSPSANPYAGLSGIGSDLSPSLQTQAQGGAV